MRRGDHRTWVIDVNVVQNDEVALGRNVIVEGEVLAIKYAANDLQVFAQSPVVIVRVPAGKHGELFVGARSDK